MESMTEPQQDLSLDSQIDQGHVRNTKWAAGNE